MISQREVIRKYAKLMDEVNTSEFYENKRESNKKQPKNCYICKGCNHITKTIDVDSGVTPFFYGCEKCSKPATSTFYRDIAPMLEPTIEWYRPEIKEVLKLRKDPGTLKHIFNGGLMDRLIQNDKKD